MRFDVPSPGGKEIATSRKPTGYDPQFGITIDHWSDFQTVARQTHKVILVRGGKLNSIQWIDKNYPAKPLCFKSKVDADLGLLFARSQSLRKNVLANGHLLLDMTGKQSEGRDRNGETVRVPLNQTDPKWANWKNEGLIIDRETLLPFTSDYDIGAVIDPLDTRFGKTFIWNTIGESSKTSPYVQPIFDALNARMQSRGKGILPRIMHGSEAQHSGSPAHGESEKIVIFFHVGKVEFFQADDSRGARSELDKLLREVTGAPVSDTPSAVIDMKTGRRIG